MATRDDEGAAYGNMHEKKNTKRNGMMKGHEATPNIPLVSAFPSRKAWEEKSWAVLMTHIAGKKQITKTSHLLGIVLTPTERKNALVRAAAIARIQGGASYRDIGKELWLTNQTISAIKKALRERSYRSYNERGKTERVKRTYSISPNREPFRKRVRTKYGVIRMRP